MAQPRSMIAWMPIATALVVGAAFAGVMGWRVNLRALEHRVKEKQAALKKLTLSGGIPPNQEVMDFLGERDSSLEHRYQHWLKMVAALPQAEAASTDPQLYFQERFHEVQRTLERLAAARSMTAPEQLGFPKELPPSDTVPRLLAQLALIQELAGLIFEQGVGALASCKIEDPEPVVPERDDTPFLIRLPVRVRLSASLPQVLKTLGALERVTPLVDLRSVRIVGASVPESLDTELLVARYLVTTPLKEATDDEEPRSSPTQKKRTSASPRSDRSAGSTTSASGGE